MYGTLGCLRRYRNRFKKFYLQGIGADSAGLGFVAMPPARRAAVAGNLGAPQKYIGTLGST